jgi:hypothetical protein
VFFAKNISQNNSLVKSPLPDAASMQRNGNKKIIRTEIDVAHSVHIEQKSKNSFDRKFSPVFQKVDNLLQRPFIRPKRPYKSEERVMGETIAAQMHSIGLS